jgi:beta-aspartyl-peptidase (threonine type)
MKDYIIPVLIILTTMAILGCRNKTQSPDNKPEYAIVIHGGAGVMQKGSMSGEVENAYHASLKAALEIGENILKAGGSSLDAVEAVIVFLENDSLFNAGKGAVFTHEGRNELDASIMDGRDMTAGAVAGVSKVKNPISAARAVMEKSIHVMMAGRGAEEFAGEQGLEMVEPSYFYTQKRYEALQKQIETDPGKSRLSEDANTDEKRGTVGCVALDKKGNICAGTSTGGMTNKKYNRIGDSPVIGAGTYADNKTCGISCTGHGEYFIRFSVAKDVAAMMEYKGLTLQQAADEVVYRKLADKGGEGGLIGIDYQGNIVMPFNTSGMFRGYCLPGKKETFIYK